MKIRIGYGLGTGGFDPAAFVDLVDALEATGFDSLWLSERLTGEALDPLMGLAVAAGRTRRLKLGTSVLVLPGRNPLMLAKELATLDRLSAGRLLPAFGLGAPDAAEHAAFGVDRGARAAMFDESLGLIRRLWSEDQVSHSGTYFRVDGVSLRPKPFQTPPDVWLGGRAPSELRRVGRLGDGWLPSFCTPAEAEARRALVEKAAADAGRVIDPEHWGALVVWTEGPVPDRLARALAARRPGTDPGAVVAQGLDGLRARLGEFISSGFSKLVVLPAVAGPTVVDGVGTLAETVLPLQA